MEVRRSTGPLLGLVAALLGAAPAGAQAPDISGRWALTVTTDRGTTHPTITLRQDGASLSGDYGSETLGEHEVEGSVAGDTITWSFSASAQGQSFPVVYTGTLAADGTISGTIDIAGGLLTGSFRASRSGG